MKNFMEQQLRLAGWHFFISVLNGGERGRGVGGIEKKLEPREHNNFNSPWQEASCSRWTRSLDSGGPLLSCVDHQLQQLWQYYPPFSFIFSSSVIFSETSSRCLHAWRLLVQKWSTRCKIHLNSAPSWYNENLFTDTLIAKDVLVNLVCAQWELLHVTKSGVVLSTHKVRCRTRCRSEQTKTRLQYFRNQYVWHKTCRHHA